MSEGKRRNTRGDQKLAKTNYEARFEGEKSDPNTRMEALEYLCEYGVQKGWKLFVGMFRRWKGSEGRPP